MKKDQKPDHPTDATEEDKTRINEEFQRDIDFKRKQKSTKSKFLHANA